jgi:hypothetical protein
VFGVFVRQVWKLLIFDLSLEEKEKRLFWVEH